MRKLLLLAMICIISSCALKPVARVTLTQVYDFRKYTKDGFFISPNAFLGKYEPIGMVHITIYPASQKKVNLTVDTNDKTVYMVREDVTSDEMILIIKNKANELGANGLSNFEIKYIYKTLRSGKELIEVFDRYEINGFAIKI